jgi:predicted ATP-grasp superfamily ATP-dependent carboligase
MPTVEWFDDPPPRLEGGRLVLAFSGWMDGGDVSTGSLEALTDELEAEPVAEIPPEPYYIYSFPGAMDVSALFRPDCEIKDGRVDFFGEPSNDFSVAREANVLLFTGKEPNLRWREFAESIWEVVERCKVTEIYFIGSVAGIVPHTREPRFRVSASDDSWFERAQELGFGLSDYEGPASFVTMMSVMAPDRGVRMVNIVAEIPSYVSGRNPYAIRVAAGKLAQVLGLEMDFSDLDKLSQAFRAKLDEVVRDRPDLTELVRKMENDYDQEVVDSRMGDLKAWFESQDIRLE